MRADLSRWGKLVATRQGGAGVARTEAGFLLATPAMPASGGVRYTNAQLDDTAGRPRAAFLHRPPLRLELRARFSHPAHELVGTAGFGFWNDPFGMSGSWPPALPQTAWFFFASPRSKMALAAGVPGNGFKAATLNTGRPPARAAAALLLPLAPLLPAAALLMRVSCIYRRAWPYAQRMAGVGETPLALDMQAWHSYLIEWDQAGVRMAVDGAQVLEQQGAPAGPLGLVIWIDNQYLVATPQGQLAWGVEAAPAPQWLEVADLQLGARTQSKPVIRKR